jgi:hypothetical protein
MTHPDVGQNLRQCLESGYVHDIIPIESCKRATLFELRPPLHRIFLVIFFVDDGHEFEHHGHGLFAIRGPICFHLPSVQLQRQPRKWDVGLLHRGKRGRVGRSAMLLSIGLYHRRVCGRLSNGLQHRRVSGRLPNGLVNMRVECTLPTNTSKPNMGNTIEHAGGACRDEDFAPHLDESFSRLSRIG